MGLVDNRNTHKDLAAGSRKKFIEKYKKSIKRKIEQIDGSRSIKNTKGGSVTIDGTTEHHLYKDPAQGIKRKIFTGNKKFQKGQIIRKEDVDNASGNKGSDSGEGEDGFTFVLSKEEFCDIYFDDLALPNFVKRSFKGSMLQVRRRSGVAPVGPPPKLNYKKTIFQHLMRQVATSGKPDPEIGLDPIDLRYNKYRIDEIPDKRAVMFCVMDVSGSMGEVEKLIAKKFFSLLYLFLEHNYTKVEVVFIRHTQEAKEVDEHTFFHSVETGGTVVSTAIQLVNQIIEERYNTNDNIYLAQASDGDNFENDNPAVLDELDKLLPRLQYMAYVQIEGEERISSKKIWRVRDLLALYQDNYDDDHFAMVRIMDATDVFKVFRSLFKKDK